MSRGPGECRCRLGDKRYSKHPSQSSSRSFSVANAIRLAEHRPPRSTSCRFATRTRFRTFPDTSTSAQAETCPCHPAQRKRLEASSSALLCARRGYFFYRLDPKPSNAARRNLTLRQSVFVCVYLRFPLWSMQRLTRAAVYGRGSASLRPAVPTFLKTMFENQGKRTLISRSAPARFSNTSS